jgi:hypothetical protein
MKIHLASTKIRDKNYGIGECVVSIGGQQCPAIAVKAGKERRIGLRADVVAWLAARGLTLREAENFVTTGLRKDVV